MKIVNHGFVDSPKVGTRTEYLSSDIPAQMCLMKGLSRNSFIRDDSEEEMNVKQKRM